MQVSELANKKIVSDVSQKFDTYQGLVYVAVVLVAFLGYGYLFSRHYVELDSPAPALAVPLSPELQILQSKIGLSFDDTAGLRKNVSDLKDYSVPIVGGVKGRTNPFDAYASSRPTR